MKDKDVGTCLRWKNGKQIFRSKYKKPSDAQGELETLQCLNVIDPLYKVYKCPVCHMWHMGDKEWANK